MEFFNKNNKLITLVTLLLYTTTTDAFPNPIGWVTRTLTRPIKHHFGKKTPLFNGKCVDITGDGKKCYKYYEQWCYSILGTVVAKAGNKCNDWCNHSCFPKETCDCASAESKSDGFKIYFNPSNPQIDVDYPDLKVVLKKSAMRWEKIIKSKGHPLTVSYNVKDLKDKEFYEVWKTSPLAQCAPKKLYILDKKWRSVTAALDVNSRIISDYLQFDKLRGTTTHEIGHGLGIGTLWEKNDLVEHDKENCQYKGGNAKKYFKQEYDFKPANIELSKRDKCGHWGEILMGDELMTPIMDHGNGEVEPISKITIGSLEDMGYEVDYSQADSYSKPDILGSLADRLDSGIRG